MSQLIKDIKAGKVRLKALKLSQRHYSTAMANAKAACNNEAYNDAKMGYAFVELFIKNFEKIVKV